QESSSSLFHEVSSLKMGPVDIDSASSAALRALVDARNSDPFALLGPHVYGDAVVIRTLQPAAKSVDVRLATGELRAMQKVDPAGLYEVRLGSDPRSDPRSDLKPD